MSYETEYHSGYEPQYREGLEELAAHYKEILTLLGEDTEREGLMKTPMRVAKAMQVLTRGYQMDAHKVLTDALFKEDYSQMVIYTQRLHHWSFKDCPRGGYLCTSSASAGAHDTTDQGLYPGHPEAPWRDGRGRGKTHVHADARYREAECHHHHQRLQRRF